MNKLKDKIKALRTTMGWTQEELAREIDVSLATVQRWESNKVVPSRLARKELNKLFSKAKIKNSDISLATINHWEANEVVQSRLAEKELDKLFRKAKIKN